MSLEGIIRANMIEDLKNGEKDKKQVYTGILTALTNKAKEAQAELTPEQDSEVIIKIAKQNQESIDTCPDNRKDIIDRLSFEREIIVSFMPKQMTEDEIKNIIQDVLTKIGIDTYSAKDKGKVMKELMPIVKGKADGKIVNAVLESFLSK